MSPATNTHQTQELADECFFNGCINPIVIGDKCEFHRRRGKCLVDDCRNQVYARHLCVRHGGKRLCQFPGCSANARSGTLCCRHGLRSRKKQCAIDGCTKVAHARQRCVRHGGGRMCRVDDCNTHARIGGYCCRHSALQSPRKDELAPHSIVVEGDTWDISPRPFDAWEGYCILDPALGCFSEMDNLLNADELLTDVHFTCAFLDVCHGVPSTSVSIRTAPRQADLPHISLVLAAAAASEAFVSSHVRRGLFPTVCYNMAQIARLSIRRGAVHDLRLHAQPPPAPQHLRILQRRPNFKPSHLRDSY